VSVGVVCADRDERDAGSGRCEEVGIGVGTAVVGDLQDVGPEVGSRGDDACLGLRAQVTGEQDSDPAVGDPDDHRQVIGFGEGGRSPGLRSQDLDRRLTHGPPIAGDEDRPPRPGSANEGIERRSTVVGRRQRSGRHGSDVSSVQGTSQPARVVGVEVREEHQGQRVDAQPVQTAVHGADVGPGVDEHALPLSRGQDQRIPLADVAGDDDRVRRRPAAHHLPHRPPEHDQADDSGDGQWPKLPVPPQEPSDGHQQAGEE